MNDVMFLNKPHHLTDDNSIESISRMNSQTR
jgi:hypothetical protein